MHTQTAIHGDAIRRPAMPIRQPNQASIAIDAEALDHSMQLMGAVLGYPRNTEIFGENEPAEYLYKVVSGSVRTYKILTDGRARAPQREVAMAARALRPVIDLDGRGT